MRVKVRSVGERDGLAVFKGMIIVSLLLLLLLLLLLFWEDSEAKVVVFDSDGGFGFGGWGGKAAWLISASGRVLVMIYILFRKSCGGLILIRRVAMRGRWRNG